MSGRFPEAVALQAMCAKLNSAIERQCDSTRLADFAISAGLLFEQKARDISSMGQTSEYIKVSGIMSAVKGQILITGGKGDPRARVTEKFNKFVLIIHDLGLVDLAQDLVEECRE